MSDGTHVAYMYRARVGERESEKGNMKRRSIGEGGGRETGFQ